MGNMSCRQTHSVSQVRRETSARHYPQIHTECVCGEETALYRLTPNTEAPGTAAQSVLKRIVFKESHRGNKTVSQVSLCVKKKEEKQYIEMMVSTKLCCRPRKKKDFHITM